jgi:hypothetical protein
MILEPSQELRMSVHLLQGIGFETDDHGDRDERAAPGASLQSHFRRATDNQSVTLAHESMSVRDRIRARVQHAMRAGKETKRAEGVPQHLRVVDCQQSFAHAVNTIV